MRPRVRIADNVWPVISQASAAVVLPSQDREGLPCLQAQDAAQLPTFCQGFRQAVRHGQLVKEAPTQAMAEVEV